MENCRVTCDPSCSATGFPTEAPTGEVIVFEEEATSTWEPTSDETWIEMDETETSTWEPTSDETWIEMDETETSTLEPSSDFD